MNCFNSEDDCWVCMSALPPNVLQKLFAALRARNNRILMDGATNQRCAFSSDVESMFREQPPQNSFATHSPQKRTCAVQLELNRAHKLP
jgi:hypothetical protein